MNSIKRSVYNVFRHKWSSLVLAGIIAMSVFTLYWAFGLSNTFVSDVLEGELKENGHLSYNINFIKKEKLNGFKSIAGVRRVVGEPRLDAIVNSKKKSGIIRLQDINDQNSDILKKYRIEGRLPIKNDEMTIAIRHDEETLDAGDSCYITIITPDKVVNAMKYHIVGKGKIGDYSIVTSESRKILLNTEDYINRIIVYADPVIDEKLLEDLDLRIRDYCSKQNIIIDESSNYFKELREKDVIIKTFNALKIILLSIMFPLSGAAIGALVWIHAYKRRGELWTFSAIGSRDSRIIRTMIAEYILVATGGTILGIILGWITSAVSSELNGMLVFSYVIDMMLYAKITVIDLVCIFVFVLFNVFVWVRIPVGRILKQRPFSY